MTDFTKFSSEVTWIFEMSPSGLVDNVLSIALISCTYYA
jgi:hypothetical protein